MSHTHAPRLDPVQIGLIGAGRIGTSHATLLAERVPGARLVAVADPRPEAAAALAAKVGARAATEPSEVFGDPDIEAVVITASSVAHAELVTAAAAAGKAVFCEKPMGMTLEEIDRGVEAASRAGVPLQVGFNRRFSADFAAARRLIDDGAIGTPHLMRSVTRDPGLADPAGVPPWTIFTQTLIHDFDTLLWLNPGAEPVSVYATADALVAPAFKDAGLLDTAVVVITFDNGARAVAEASFSATYGYDVRGEVFGSRGMVSMGGGPRSALVLSTASGRAIETVRGDVELFADAYAAELAEFAEAVRAGRTPAVTGADARRALAVALAAIASVESGVPVDVATGAVR
ncbi:Gfo/Idh/MocA family oxidoreductase [Nocardioides pocheonensis]|uniref:Dehydrogenase n=1 Tax=Nocardioides pocheonensis TaxID=661485 RepID=A0A3N0GX65_9ACTN|nr:Gfo/Idh/MocA family oxidoreductase [Nocardioides pocheonensis]RNM17011.1 dehydrogenase [Nocardioides pocheonensis]